MIHIDFNKLRFLIVDDNLHMRRILRTLLHGFGARDVIEAEDGAGGLEGFSQGNPDIVFLDWEMPNFWPNRSLPKGSTSVSSASWRNLGHSSKPQAISAPTGAAPPMRAIRVRSAAGAARPTPSGRSV
jgi:DNA-binding NarL/FixJ family response regulator